MEKSKSTRLWNKDDIEAREGWRISFGGLIRPDNVRQTDGETPPKEQQTNDERLEVAPNATELAQLNRTAEAGDADAQFRLGCMYHEGAEVDQNDKAARIWFQRAALHGHAHALYMLGLCYAGGYGCARDLVDAYACALAASQMGYWDALPALEVFSEGMSVADRDKAKRASEFYVQAPRLRAEMVEKLKREEARVSSSKRRRRRK